MSVLPPSGISRSRTISAARGSANRSRGNCRGSKGDKVLVKRDGTPIPAQVVATADGVRVLLIIDRLAKDASTTLTADLDQQGPTGTDLSIAMDTRGLVLANKYTAVRLNNGGAGNVSPILGIRTASGKWTGGGTYDTKSAKPVSSKTELLEKGPVRLAARVTTTFDNGKTHVVTVGLWSGSHSIDVDETFDVGPDDKYQFKKYANDKDELAWEWWSWYGDREGLEETHPNNWVFRLASDAYRPEQITYCGQASTDSDKGKVASDNHAAGLAEYTLANGKERRLEKYLAGHTQWRPDSVLWYLTSPTKDDGADAVAVYTHSVRNWRNPNVLPTPKGITLRTGANDIRVISRARRQTTRAGVSHRPGPPLVGHPRFHPQGDARSRGHLAHGPGRRAGPAVHGPRHHAALDHRLGNEERLPAPVHQAGGKGGVLRAAQGQGNRVAGQHARLLPPPPGPAQLRPRLRRDRQAGRPDDRRLLVARHGQYGRLPRLDARLLARDHRRRRRGQPLRLAAVHARAGPALKKKLAILTYALVSPDAWPDKQINYGWGSMNMPVARWGGRVVLASALSDHPLAKTWLKDAGRYFRMLLETEYAPDGTHISCPHYIGAASTSFYAWIAMANSGLAEDMSTAPALKKFARYYMQLMKPIDPRWGIRVLMNEGDTRPGSSPLPAILARFFKRSDPELAGQLMQLWNEGGRDLGGGMGIPDALVIDAAIPPRPLKMGPQVNRGFGAFLRYRELGTPEESYLALVGGDFMIDHANADQFGFAWNEKGVPLTDFEGAMYQPMACTAVSHTTLAWDVRPGGGPIPARTSPATGTTTTTSPTWTWAVSRRGCTGRSASTRRPSRSRKRGAW